MTFDPLPLLRILIEEGVDFVVIGGVAGQMYGSAHVTFDLDVAYSREARNLVRAVTALRRLNATLRGAPPGLPFQLDAETLEEGGNFTFDTDYGAFDILAYPAGAPPYQELRGEATFTDVEGLNVPVASLDHLIGMKQAAGRPKDLLQASEYRAISDELRAPLPEKLD